MARETLVGHRRIRGRCTELTITQRDSLGKVGVDRPNGGGRGPRGVLDPRVARRPISTSTRRDRVDPHPPDGVGASPDFPGGARKEAGGKHSSVPSGPFNNDHPQEHPP